MRFIPDKEIPAINVPDLTVVIKMYFQMQYRASAHYALLHTYYYMHRAPYIKMLFVLFVVDLVLLRNRLSI